MGGGGVYRSDDGGHTWTYSGAGMDANGIVRSIAIDPTDSQIVYIADAFSGVHVSLDGGVSWQLLIDGLTHRSVEVLAISDDGSVLYAGADGGGVFRLGALP